jgi:hypothetical protein
MAEQRDMNYFTNELYQYYLEHGITLSEETMNVMNKIPLELSGNEREVYVKFILPRRHQIKQALKTRFVCSGARKEVWHNNLRLYSRSVIGQIASEMLIEEEVALLEPIPPGPPTAPGPPAPPGQVLPPEQPAPPMQLEQEILPVLPISIKRSSPLLGIKMGKNRRKIFQRKRKVGRLVIAGSFVVLLLLLSIFLFSPWGPWGHLLFKTSGAKSNNPGYAEGGSGVSGRNGNAGQAAGAPRSEKASDATPPTIAIVVDDVGENTSNLSQWLAIDAPLTFSVMPHCTCSRDLAEQLYQAGYRIMLHVPTENQPPHSYAGNGQIATAMDRETVFRTLDDDLATVPYVVGINNHEGGKGCDDLQLMTWECEWAKENDLFVVDSRSSAQSKVSQAGTSLGLERRCNQAFLDEQNNPDYIRSAMRQLADLARLNGIVIGVCHFPRPNTPSVVGEMVRELEAGGIHFAFVEDIHN